ncbi:MAG: Ig-like domain-containing protein [Deinococcales bacterium]
MHRYHRYQKHIRYLLYWFMLGFLSMISLVQASDINLLNSATATASGAGSSGTPSISSFNIPEGVNRVLLILAMFERDHCDLASDLCDSSNSTGTGLGDNFANPNWVTGNRQLTARVTGSATVDKLNALTVGGTPSGDLRFLSQEGYPNPPGNSTGTYFSGQSFHIALLESEISTVLGGATSGSVSITLPDALTPKSAGDEAILMAFVFENVEQTDTGTVRSGTDGATANGINAGSAGNYTMSIATLDAGQAPDETDDGFLVMAVSRDTVGFNAISGYTPVQSTSITNSGGRFDDPNGNTHNEPNGMSAATYFKNGSVSSVSIQAAGSSATLTSGGWLAVFTLESAELDMSDAPTAGTVVDSVARNYGIAAHTVPPSPTVYLNTAPDTDNGGLENATATGDDVNATNDETFNAFSTLTDISTSYSLSLTCTGSGATVAGWIDFNRDGTFESGERASASCNGGTANLSWTGLSGLSAGTTFARFRIASSATEVVSPTGSATSGEVEDYQLTITSAFPRLTLLKTAINDNAGTAVDTAWTLSATGPVTISGVEGDATITNATVSAGTYTLAESGPSGYTQIDLSCTGGTLSGADLTLANGDNVICTFTNDDNVIDAIDDDYSATPVNSITGGVAGDVTLNDTLNGVDVTDSEISITLDNDGGLTGATISSDGNVNVPAGTTAGTYTLTYTICENLNPSNCDTATATVVVEAGAIDAVNDFGGPIDENIGGDAGINVLTNDELNGNPVNPAEVTLSPISDGTLTVNADGSVTVAPNTLPGTHTIDYTICENLNPTNCDTATVTIEVVDSGNPDALDDSATTAEDTPVNIDVLLNDSLIDNATLTSYDPVSVNGGTISQDPVTGELIYTPASGFVGTDSFTYTICDDDIPSPTCDTATVSIEVLDDGNPDALDDSATTAEDTPVNIDVLLNDSLIDNATLTSYDPVSVNGGSISQDPVTGELIYTPATGFVGTDSFTYTICDDDIPSPTCDTATVSIEVLDDGNPDALDDSATTNEDVPVNIDVLLNDSLIDNATLTSYDPVSVNGGTISQDPVTGELIYTPASGFVGTDSFTYTICDDDIPSPTCDTATVSIEVLDDGNPDALDDSATTAEDTPVNIDVLLNDSLIDNATLTSYDPVSVNGGTISQDPVTGELIYTPASGFVGTDSFTYTICDDDIPSPTCDTATVSIIVADEGNPTANDDSTSTREDTPVNGRAFGNDSLVDNAGLTSYDRVSTQGGTVIMNPNGSYTYTPALGFVGTDGFTYTICDDDNPPSCDTATVTITVEDEGNPDAVDDFTSTLEDTPVSGQAFSNDSLIDDAQLSTYDSLSANGGSVQMNPDGSYTYTPAQGFVGTDSFTYTICDDDNPPSCDTATVTITVEDEGNPDAVDDSAVVRQDESVTIDWTVNDSLIDQAVLTSFDAVSTNGGTITLNPDGSFNYTPSLGFVGTDTFTYTICDDDNPPSCDTATVTIEVQAPPVAIDDEVVAQPDSPVTISVIGNDYDLDGMVVAETVRLIDPVTGAEVLSVTILGEGTYTVNPDGTISFVPEAGFRGQSSVQYVVYDNDGLVSNAATLSIIVPELAVAKEVIAANVASSGTPGNFEVTFELVIENVGGGSLVGLSLVDDLVSQLGGAFVALVVVPTISDSNTANLPNLNPSYTGFAPNSDIFDGISGQLNSGEYIRIQLTIEIDPDHPSAILPLHNQATGSASTPDGVTVVDNSDSGSNPATTNPGEPGDNGTKDDATPISLPSMGVAKSVLGDVINHGDGRYTVSYRIIVANTGNTNLDNVQVSENLAEVFAAAQGFSVTSLSSDSLSVNSAFDGQGDTGLLTIGNSLAVGQTATLDLSVTIIPGSNMGPYLNTVLASAQDPSTGTDISDTSDSGTNPATTNPEDPNDTGTANDATPVSFSENPLLGLAKEANEPVADYDNEGYLISYIFTLKNYGDVVMSNIQVTDNLDNVFGTGRYSVSSIESVSLSVNLSFNGSSDVNLLTGADSLAVGTSATVTLTVFVPFSSIDSTSSFSNIAAITANSPTGQPVSDQSSGGNNNNPDPDNDGNPTNNDNATTITLTPPAEPQTEIRIRIDKQVADKVYTIGEEVPYTLIVTNDNEFEAITVDITDTPPTGTSYVPGTATITIAGETTPREPVLENGQMKWLDLSFKPGEQIIITYTLRIGPDAADSLNNVVEAVGEGTSGRSTAKVTANADIAIDRDIFNIQTSILTGKVFLDVDGDDEFNPEQDMPLPGARVVLGTGLQVQTDGQGNYAFRDVPVGDNIVQLDALTAPFMPRPHPEASGDGYLHRIRVQGLTVSNFPLTAPSGYSLVGRETTLTYGSLTLHKRHVELPEGIRVVIELSSTDALPYPVSISDPVPNQTTKVFERDITANYQETITYDVPVGTEFTDPEITWK